MITIYLVIYFAVILSAACSDIFREYIDPFDKKYGFFSEADRLQMVEETRKMFHFGYDSYMKHAFPADELNPIDCSGRGPDVENPDNININDVLGDYVLTLVDTLDTLAIMGNTTEFQKAVKLIKDNISFEKPNTIQVFEATIRVMGSLLSAHLIITDPIQPFGDMHPGDYDDDLLHLAHDLAARLLPAFENTQTGIPYPRVNLQTGVPNDCVNETCTAGAGTLLLEFGLLSRLLNDPIYESVARRAVNTIWDLRSNVTGLLGNVINIQTGKWVGLMSGVGAGMDSFFEYMFKSFILFGEKYDLHMFNESYKTIKHFMRKGRKECNMGDGFPPIYVNVNMKSGDVVNNWIDSLGAAWPSVQVLNGDIEDAICVHALYYSLWRRFGALPERYNWHLKSPEVLFYPLRPELVESTYYLYRATKNPFYLHVGRDILNTLNKNTKVQCGYATIHDVNVKDHEDRMESFFLSETCKYLYLLFDFENHVNKESINYILSTEGHLFPLDKRFRRKPWETTDETFENNDQNEFKENLVTYSYASNTSENCMRPSKEKKYILPLQSKYLRQLESLVGLDAM